MRKWFERQWARWRAHQERKAGQYLQSLKVRYQLFRALLDNNNRAVHLITRLEVKLRSPNPLKARLLPDITSLLETSEQMTEKMIRLGGERYRGLVGRHRQISAGIMEALAGLPSAEGLPYCIPLDQAGPELLHAVGGKAAKLAKLRRRPDYGVPDGFVVPVHGCRLFIEQESLSLRLFSGLRPYIQTGAETLPRMVVEQIQQVVLETPLPAAVEQALTEAGHRLLETAGENGLAVRSSAISEDSQEHSFAGQYATILHVCTLEDLITAFKKVMASSFASRSIAYRLHAGLDPLAFDMAVLCMVMVPARASGILFTRDPNQPAADRMLVSGVFGLGELAVAGSGTADLYLPSRTGGADSPDPIIARKEHRLALQPDGGLAEEPVPENEQQQPVLNASQLHTLVEWGLAVEKAENGLPQDIEWALDPAGRLHLLQSRPLKLVSPRRSASAARRGRQEVLLSGGIVTAGGLATGRAYIARSRQALQELPEGPVILVLHQSLVDAVSILGSVRGVLVDFGNPADHLSCVAREYAVPMLTGLAHATETLHDGQWLTVDAHSGRVLASSPEAAVEEERRRPTASPRAERPAGPVAPQIEQMRQLIVRLHLTDAYGPTFSILECRSIHDLVRFMHEKAVLAMFSASDQLLEKTTGTVFTLEAEVPFLVSIVDLGGGLLDKAPRRRRITPAEILCLPLRALWQGVTDPRLHWGPPPGGVAVNSVMSRWLGDSLSERPVGMPNYAIISRDYLNLNARMDFHFTMVDAICGPHQENNYIKFRFKGGGTSMAQRRRRAACIAEILQAHNFFTDVQEDLINGQLQGLPEPVVADKLIMLGRLLGFTRLLDAAMQDEKAPHRIARAFLEGDYRLVTLSELQGGTAGEGGKSPA